MTTKELIEKLKSEEVTKHLTEKCKHPGSYPNLPGNPEGWCKLCREKQFQEEFSVPIRAYGRKRRRNAP